MTSTLSPTFTTTDLSAGGPSGTGHRPADQQLYVTAPHKVRDRSGEPPFSWVPYGVQHAWTAGARRTLCGEWTSGWIVFWERPFSAKPQDACPACVEASLPAASRNRLDPALRRTA